MTTPKTELSSTPGLAFSPLVKRGQERERKQMREASQGDWKSSRHNVRQPQTRKGKEAALCAMDKTLEEVPRGLNKSLRSRPSDTMEGGDPLLSASGPAPTKGCLSTATRSPGPGKPRTRLTKALPSTEVHVGAPGTQSHSD